MTDFGRIFFLVLFPIQFFIHEKFFAFNLIFFLILLNSTKSFLHNISLLVINLFLTKKKKSFL